MAWYVTPISAAAEETVPPSSCNAWLLSMGALNHGSGRASTAVQPTVDSMVRMGSAYWDRIKPAMDAAGMDIADLARSLQISYQAVAKLPNGGAFGSNNNIKAARLFGLNPEWLATGRGTREAGAVQVEPSVSIKTALPVVLRAIAGAPAPVRNELAQVLALFAQSGADTYGLRIKELLGVDQRQPRLARASDDRAEVNPRELENVIGSLIELAGTPSAEARAKGKRIALELTAPRPASATADQEADHGSAV